LPSLPTIDATKELLGKQVRVTLDRPEHGPARIVEGKLLAFDTGGEFMVEQNDGFVMYCWPMLDIEAKP
jgi:hypothetical protein